MAKDTHRPARFAPPLPLPQLPQPRLPQLDALRGLAALAVVLFHYTVRYDELGYARNGNLLWTMPLGFHGVDLFFMLSGFVMLLVLSRENRPLDFTVHRLTRIYPTYWAAVIFTFCLVSYFGLPGQEVSPRDAAVNLTMVQSLLKTPHVDGAYWSLQAELLFYLALTVLLAMGATRLPLRMVGGWLLLALIAQLATIFLGERSPALASLIHKLQTLLSLEYIGLFAIGMILHDAWQRKEFRFRHAGLLLLALAVHTLVRGWIFLPATVLLTIIFAAALFGKLRWLNCHPLLALGAISYSLYLVHQNLGYIVMRWAAESQIEAHAAVLLALLAALLAATAMHWLIERPALKWSRRGWKVMQGYISRTNLQHQPILPSANKQFER